MELKLQGESGLELGPNWFVSDRLTTKLEEILWHVGEATPVSVWGTSLCLAAADCVIIVLYVLLEEIKCHVRLTWDFCSSLGSAAVPLVGLCHLKMLGLRAASLSLHAECLGTLQRDSAVQLG